MPRVHHLEALNLRRGKLLAIVASLVVLSVVPFTIGARTPVRASAPSQPAHIDCEYSRICPDVADPTGIYDEYVGHDEPSAIFYSNTPGSGNRMQYNVTLPKDPPPSDPLRRSYHFELNGAIWFGMALCDTQSYPEQVSTCTPDSDRNITSNLAEHPGAAFLELQFYPPGWIPWPAWQVAVGADTCDPTKWCAAMNIFSLLQDPVNGTLINPTCRAQIGVETFEFAFVTKNGVSHAPANPLNATLATYTPDPTRDLFMSSGDQLSVGLHDTSQGVQARINDLTSGETGSMTASPANGFAQFKYEPTGTSCTAIPYAFHPMYSTSSPSTRVPWAAHTYNVAFSDEIGHFQLCNGAAVPATPFGVDSNGNPIACPLTNTEGFGSDQEPSEGAGEDDFCFPASEALLYAVQGCSETNTGFDGLSYLPLWPDGNTALHPTSFKFTSPLTGADFDQPYPQTAFEANLPRIERGQGCSRVTGARCTLIPITDDGEPAAFYPFFSTIPARQDSNSQSDESCSWQFGNDTPDTTNDFSKNTQYGSLLAAPYLIVGGHGATHLLINNYRGVIDNPC
jgi:hypothetical protein